MSVSRSTTLQRKVETCVIQVVSSHFPCVINRLSDEYRDSSTTTIRYLKRESSETTYVRLVYGVFDRFLAFVAASKISSGTVVIHASDTKNWSIDSRWNRCLDAFLTCSRQTCLAFSLHSSCTRAENELTFIFSVRKVTISSWFIWTVHCSIGGDSMPRQKFLRKLGQFRVFSGFPFI